MLSKKRAILFEVMGHRARPSRPKRAYDTPVPTGRRPDSPVPRTRPAPKSRPKSRSLSWQRLTPAARWAALAGVVVVAVTFAVWRLQRPAQTQAPQLQTNVREEARPGGEAPQAPARPAAHAFAVCAMERAYKTPAERRLAAEKVQEIVNFLGYDSDPSFRDDVRAKDCQGKEPGTGVFRIYVGSADRKPELIPLRDKLVMAVYKKARPFQNASIRLVER